MDKFRKIELIVFLGFITEILLGNLKQLGVFDNSGLRTVISAIVILSAVYYIYLYFKENKRDEKLKVYVKPLSKVDKILFIIGIVMLFMMLIINLASVSIPVNRDLSIWISFIGYIILIYCLIIRYKSYEV